MARELTERQKLFLEYLFHPEIKGNAHKAKVQAGYAPEYATSSLVKALKDEILEATRDYLTVNGPKAALTMIGVMDDPTELGVKEKMLAAKDVLDRVGVVKTEKVEITSSGLFILPSKDKEEE